MSPALVVALYVVVVGLCVERVGFARAWWARMLWGVGLAMVLALFTAGVGWSQPSSTLGPQGPYYYRQGGDRPVRIADGGTDSRSAPAARYALGIPCRTCLADSISANWKLTGSIRLPFTYWSDTLGVFTDDADTTKKAKFQLSSIGAGATRWYTWPNRSGVVALENGATMTSATMTGSSIDQSSIRVLDTQMWIKDNADTTKRVQFDASNNTAGATRIFPLPAGSATAAVNTIATQGLDNQWTGTNTTLANWLVDTFNGGSLLFPDDDGGVGVHKLWSHARAQTVDIFFPEVPTGAYDFLLETSTQPVGSKTLYTTNTISARDDRFTIGDNADTTKKIAFEASGITTGTTRTYTGPNASGTLALTTSTLSGGVSDGVLYDNVTYTKDASWTMKDDADTTKKFQFQASGITAGTTRTYTMPNATTTLAATSLNNSFTIGQQITASTAGNRCLLLKMAASATASPLVVQNSASSEVFSVGTDGSFTGSGFGLFGSYVLAMDSVMVMGAGNTYLNLYNSGGFQNIVQAGAATGDVVFTLPTVPGRVLVQRDSLNRGGQVASIGTANLSTSPPAGMYEINYTLESTASAAAGTVTVTFGWTDNAGAATFTSTALTLTASGRLTDNYPRTIYVASGNITYATTVAGLSGTPAYTLRVRLTPKE